MTFIFILVFGFARADVETDVYKQGNMECHVIKKLKTGSRRNVSKFALKVPNCAVKVNLCVYPITCSAPRFGGEPSFTNPMTEVAKTMVFCKTYPDGSCPMMSVCAGEDSDFEMERPVINESRRDSPAKAGGGYPKVTQ